MKITKQANDRKKIYKIKLNKDNEEKHKKAKEILKQNQIKSVQKRLSASCKICSPSCSNGIPAEIT